jgi:thiol:disulfide interchange protein DsbD
MRLRRSLPWLAAAVVLLAVLAPGVAHAADGSFSSYQERGWAWMFLASFGFGFLTSLTPCVYPMIPITLAIFGARGAGVSKRRSLALATTYVLGMGVTYAVLGVIVATAFGVTDFGKQLGHPAFVIPLVILFVAMAASMFGAFEMNLPSGLQAKLNQIGGKGFRGAFAMGAVGGLIAAPCTGPYLLGLLAFTAKTSALTGGALLFVYALGMGVLFFVLAVFASSLPKSGPWMEKVKSASGIAMLFAAIYFLEPLLPWMRTFASPEIWFLGASVAVAMVGLALGAIHLSFHGTPAGVRARKALGIALVVGGAFCVWGWWLAPKRHLPWLHDETAAYAKARAEHKGVMVDFAADWCNPCKEMEKTFGDDDVYEAITSSFVPLKIDITSSTDENEEQTTRYRRGPLPQVIFMATDGTELDRIDGVLGRAEMLDRVTRAAAARPSAP